MRNTAPEITEPFIFDDRNYGTIIIEELGLADGISTEMMVSIAAENFATDQRIAAMTYQGRSDGLNIIFPDTIIVDKNI